jgi:protein gp37
MIVRRWWKKEWGEFPGYAIALLKLGTPVLVEDELKAVLRLSERIAKGKANPDENKIFWNDMTDEFLDFWPDEFIDRCWAVRALTPNLIHQVLTKRIDRAAAYFSDLNYRTEMIGITAESISGISRSTDFLAAQWPLPLVNVHLGVSVEDQKTADERIPVLLETPAAVRWISAEPLLGSVDLSAFMGVTPNITGEREQRYSELDWVVVGGESGPRARGMNLDWLTAIMARCKAAHVPVFVKQLGAHPFQQRPAEGGPKGVREALASIAQPHPQSRWFRDWTLISQGNESWWVTGPRLQNKKGGDINEWSEDLRVREFPKVAEHVDR